MYVAAFRQARVLNFNPRDAPRLVVSRVYAVTCVTGAELPPMIPSVNGPNYT